MLSNQNQQELATFLSALLSRYKQTVLDWHMDKRRRRYSSHLCAFRSVNILGRQLALAD